MGELISRAAVLDAIRDRYPDAGPVTSRILIGLMHDIRQIPVEEVEPVVRCRECVRRYVKERGTTHYYICDYMAGEIKDDAFCSRGKRRNPAGGDGGA